MSRVRRPRLVRKRYFAEKTREKAPLESRFSPLIEAILPLGIAIRKSANAVAGRANAFALWANAIAASEIAITSPAKALPNARNCVRKRSERDRPGQQSRLQRQQTRWEYSLIRVAKPE